MLKKLLALAWMVLVIVAIGCKGPEGAVGPKGDKGDTGATGATGATGPAGKDGTGGSSAFVMTSGADTTDADGGFVMALTGLTANDKTLLENSAVLVYIKSGGAYWPIPGLVPFTGNKFSDFLTAHYIDGNNFVIEMFQSDWSETQDTAPVRIVQGLKAVVVPAAVLGRLNGEVDLKNYEETIAALGIDEAAAKTAGTSKP